MRQNKVAQEVPGSQLIMRFNPFSLTPDVITETQLHIIHPLPCRAGLAGCIVEAALQWNPFRFPFFLSLLPARAITAFHHQ